MMWRIDHLNYGDPGFDRLLKARAESVDRNPAYEPNFDLTEDRRDKRSDHLAFMHNDKLIGGIRLTPIGLKLTLTERLVDIVGAVREGIAIDTNRLFILPDRRGSGSLHWYLLQTCVWAMENTTATVFTAVCNDRLVPLYEGIGGARVLSDLVWRYESGEKKYNFFLLGIERVRETIERRFPNEQHQKETEFGS